MSDFNRFTWWLYIHCRWYRNRRNRLDRSKHYFDTERNKPFNPIDHEQSK